MKEGKSLFWFLRSYHSFWRRVEQANEGGFFLLQKKCVCVCKMNLTSNLKCVTGSKRTKCVLQYLSHCALLKQNCTFFANSMPPGKSPTRIQPLLEPTIEKVDLTHFLWLSWLKRRVWRTVVWLFFAKIALPRGTRKTTTFRFAKKKRPQSGLADWTNYPFVFLDQILSSDIDARSQAALYTQKFGKKKSGFSWVDLHLFSNSFQIPQRFLIYFDTFLTFICFPIVCKFLRESLNKLIFALISAVLQ